MHGERRAQDALHVPCEPAHGLLHLRLPEYDAPCRRCHQVLCEGCEEGDLVPPSGATLRRRLVKESGLKKLSWMKSDWRPAEPAQPAALAFFFFF